jgi:hypothetical protein
MEIKYVTQHQLFLVVYHARNSCCLCNHLIPLHNKSREFLTKLAAFVSRSDAKNLLPSLRLAIPRVEYCPKGKSMSFVDHGGIGKVFPAHEPETVEPTDGEWDINRLRSELLKRKVWVASLPSNVECWHQQVLEHVEEGRFTFIEFVDTFADQIKFDFGKAIEALLSPAPRVAGGWYNSELAD